MLRSGIACFFMNTWVRWRSQGLGFPPGSHYRRYLMYQLCSIPVISNQIVGLSVAIGRQQENRVEFLFCFWNLDPAAGIASWCILNSWDWAFWLKVVFLSEDLYNLRHYWCLSCYMCGMSFVRRTFMSSLKNRKEILAWNILIRSFIVCKCDRRCMCLLKALLGEPHIHCKLSS